MTIEQQAHLEALSRKAESGEEWAEICRLEALYTETQSPCTCGGTTEHYGRCPMREDRDPAPYCSYGHRTKEQCDCGPIAAND